MVCMRASRSGRGRRQAPQPTITNYKMSTFSPYLLNFLALGSEMPFTFAGKGGAVVRVVCRYTT